MLACPPTFSLALATRLVHNLPMQTAAISADDLLGTYRSFGSEGPVYQVLERVGEEAVRILVVETGETLDYPVEQALADPEVE
jgi:hypothetical protein